MILSPWQSPSFDKFGKKHFLFYHKYKLMTIRDKIIIVKVTELNYNLTFARLNRNYTL
jgi:hypothetical protein